MAEQTGVILNPGLPSNSLRTAPVFAVMNGRRCGTTNIEGRYPLEVPPKTKARIVALLPPDVVLSAQYKLDNHFADFVEDDSSCWCVSNVDTSPHLLVFKNIKESGSFDLVTFPPVMGMTVCVELMQEN